MGAIRAVEVLLDVAFALIEQPVNTQVNPSGPIAPGVVVATPGSMVGIYAGALLVAGYAGAGEEVVTVISTTASTFTAQFINAHAASDPLVGPTFPSGQVDHPLFTQSEMLGYLADVQNDFLLRVRPIYKAATAPLTTNTTKYVNPADAIRVERIAVAGQELFNVAQTDLDWLDPGWQQSALPANPQYWYQDGINLSYGIAPVIQRNDTSELFYSQKAATSLALLDSFLVPDPMTFILKWGVLARAFSKDGEARDAARSKFCQTFYEMLCFVSLKFLEGVQGRIKRPEETVEPALAAMGGK